MPTFTTQYAPPGAYVQFLQSNLSPNASANYRIPVLIGTGTTSKVTKTTLVRTSGDTDSIGIPSVTSIVSIGNNQNTTDYTQGVDYILGTDGQAGEIVWTSSGTVTVGSFTLTDLANGSFSNAITATKIGSLVNDSYVLSVVTVGPGSTFATYVGNSPIASSMTVTETINITIDSIEYPVTISNGDAAATVITEINDQIGSVATASINSSNQFTITTLEQGSQETIEVSVISTTLKGELGINDGVSDSFTYTVGTTGTGQFSITPRSTRTTTAYMAGQIAITDIPGISITVLTTSAEFAGENAEIVATADTDAINPLTGATYYITVISAKQDSDYDLAYFTLDDEETFYAIYGDPGAGNTLSLGAYVCFRNQVSILAVVQLNGGTDLPYWEAAVDQLIDQPIYYIVPLTSDPLVQAYVQNHVDDQSSILNRRERTAIFGGAAGYALFDFTDSAMALNDERIVFTAPASWNLNYVTSANFAYTLSVSGCYAAAAVASIASLVDPATPLTRAKIVGLSPLVTYNPTEQNELATAGVMVLTTQAGVTRIRHQLTTNANGPIESREFSIVQLRDYVSVTLRNNLEAEYVGIKVLLATPAIIETYVIKILDALVQQQIITGYANVSVVQDATDPTQMDVSFEASPVYPLNYILITFTFVQQAQTVS